MAAPKSAPMPPVADTRAYGSPEHVPDHWFPDRPGLFRGPQPRGPRLGTQGPDQGYLCRLVKMLEPELHLQSGEQLADVIRGAVVIGLRRASVYGRAPIMDDARVALTIWGFFDPDPPGELVQRRRELFEGIGNVVHHYAEGRQLADLVPDWVLRSTPAELDSRVRSDWQELTGAAAVTH